MNKTCTGNPEMQGNIVRESTMKTESKRTKVQEHNLNSVLPDIHHFRLVGHHSSISANRIYTWINELQNSTDKREFMVVGLCERTPSLYSLITSAAMSSLSLIKVV